MTLGEWLEQWMHLYIWPGKLAPNTKQCYDRAVRAVPAALAARPLDEISALDVLPWLLDVARSHPRAAQLDRVMLSRALRIAGKLGLCRPGIIDPDTCPQISHQPRKADILTVEQLRTYMAAACRHEEPAAISLAFCACGLRRGEARGVTWADIDLMVGVMMVTGQRQGMGPKQPCKTRASVRGLELPECVLAALKRGHRGFPGMFVADTSENSLYRLHRAILCECGLPSVTLHGLRHSVATALVGGSAPMKAVQGLLGHAHYQVTADIYANHLPSCSDLCKRLFV